MPNHTLSHQNFKQKHPVRRKTWFDWTAQSHTKLLQVAAIVSYVRPQDAMRSVVQILGRLCYRDFHLWHSHGLHRDMKHLLLNAAQHGLHRALPFPMLMGPRWWTEKDNPRDHSMSFADPHVNMSRPWNMEAHMEHIAGFFPCYWKMTTSMFSIHLTSKTRGQLKDAIGRALELQFHSAQVPQQLIRQHQTLMEYQPWSYTRTDAATATHATGSSQKSCEALAEVIE